MTQSYIQLPTDAANTGKKLQTFDNTVLTNDVYSEAVTIVNSSGVEEGTSTNPVRIDPVGTTVQPDNVAQWGGTSVTAATASAAVGTETAPVIRDIFRKSTGNSETSTPLSANGVYTGAAHDTLTTGDVSVTASFFANVGSITNGASIQESDDNTNWTTVSVGTLTSSVLLVVSAQITLRYWRIVYTNGGTIQASFAVFWAAMNVATAVSPVAPIGAGAPTLVSGQTGPLSLNTGGALRVCANSASTATDNVTATAPNNSTSANVNPMATANWVATNSPATGSGFVAQRTPAIFKTVSVPATASGNTAVWTPTSGKKFRLMRFQITASNIAATAATVLTISFQDATTPITIGTYDILMPAVANLQSGVLLVSEWIDLGNGIISAAANNVLNANISATVTGATGTFRVNACGTEE